MSTRFIGNGNGLVLTCNHGDVWISQQVETTDAGKTKTAHTWPEKCHESVTTGQLLRSAIRHYAGTIGWLTLEVDDKKRDFCPTHAAERKAWLANRKAERDRVRREAKEIREAGKMAKRSAWLAKLAGWKAAREAKAATKAARKAAE